MNGSIASPSSRSDRSLRALLRGLGRVAIWTTLGLLLLRGIVAEPSAPTPVASSSSSATEPATAAFAVRFARAYLEEPAAAALSSFLVEGAELGAGRPPQASGLVAQAEVSDTYELGDGKTVLTVACELRDARTLYLAVPIVRSEAGEVAALGAPSLVAAPDPAGAVDPERPQPVTGPDAGAIQALVEKFLPAYVTQSEAADLAYLVAPGAEVRPLGGGLDFVSISGVTQLGSGEGARRVVLAAARLTDPASGATYPVAYRLELIKGARWYVRGIEGAVA